MPRTSVRRSSGVLGAPEECFVSHRDDQGGLPPADDRTLLDPLSTDELKALRQARQRLQQQQRGSDARPRQMVVGPEGDASLAHAPTRSMPALPKFDDSVSLDQIRSSPRSEVIGTARDPASMPPVEGPGDLGPEPMSVFSGTVRGSANIGDEPTITPGTPPPAYRPPQAGPPGPGPSGGPGPGPNPAGATGFGENTLMWMQPPRGAGPGRPGSAGASSDALSPVSVKVSFLERLKTAAVVGGVLALMGAIGAATLYGGESGVIELHTDPVGAKVQIDGQEQTERTPVKLTMNEGEHSIRLSLEGYETKHLSVVVDPEKPSRERIVLEPTSRAGMLTVTIEVQPVAATIKVNGTEYPSKRALKVPNLDPSQPHTVVVEAAGYKRIEQTVPAGKLKSSYTFALQTDRGTAPE